MVQWYVGSLADDAHAAAICDQAALDPLYKQKSLRAGSHAV